MRDPLTMVINQIILRDYIAIACDKMAAVSLPSLGAAYANSLLLGEARWTGLLLR